MLSKMNLISVVQQLPKEDIETIQGYVEMIEEENKRLLKTITHNEKCRRKMQKSLMSIIEKQKEVIDKVNKKLNNFIDCCKAEKLESGSDYIHHQYWDMFERFNKQIKDILNEV